MAPESNETRRNAPCPCGSGKRFKHCHGSFDAVQRAAAIVNDLAARTAEQQKVYGRATPMVSFEFHGERFVGVGPRLYHSPNWRTPIDFLAFWIQECLGRGWGAAEQDRLFEQRHPILQFAASTGKWHATPSPLPSGLKEAFATGAAIAYYGLAFDLWLVENQGKLDNALIKRLKLADSYQGARYELWLRAVFLKAGYEIELEDETDGDSTHVEFNVRNPQTGRWFSVEAKATARAGQLGKTEGSDEMIVRINANLKAALKKKAKYDRMVFIDLNLPPHEGEAIRSAWAEQASEELKHRQQVMTDNANEVKAHVVLTNHPFHYVGEAVWVQKGMVMASAMNIDGFLVGAPTSKDTPGAREWSDKFQADHPELTDLMFTLETMQAIPTDF